MDEEIHRLKRVIAKTFRKAKRWYLLYLMSQIAVLVAAIASVLVEFNPLVSAVIAFVGVLVTECVRWRSDWWKSEGDSAKRRWEIADGLGASVDDGAIADWLAAKPARFLDDVTENELKGSEFDSQVSPGPRRLIENTEESAWWSKHESRVIAWYLGISLIVLLVGIFFALVVSISRLSSDTAVGDPKVTQYVGAIICAVLAFVFSINVVRLLVDFVTFYLTAKGIVARCVHLLEKSEPDDREALLILFDYQISRNSAPLLPTFVWKFHGAHLRSEWKRFRRTRSA